MRVLIDFINSIKAVQSIVCKKSDTSRDIDWHRVTISAIFSFFRIRVEPTTEHPKENSLNLEEDLEEGLLNKEQKQAPRKKY